MKSPKSDVEWLAEVIEKFLTWIVVITVLSLIVYGGLVT